MKVIVNQSANANIAAVSARCPHCGKEAVLSQLGQDIATGGNVVCGQRICPDQQCKGHLFVISQAGRLIASYPAIRIDFNAENIPEDVRNTFEEVLDCHAAGAFVACAIMVRRTLEEVCSDRGATGNNLKARLTDLQSKIVLPQELIEAMDELRLLGNDAAHIEAQTFDQVSEEELDVAIEFTKEILKGLYQYSSLLSRLRGLKK